MAILEFTDIELEIEDLEARAKGLDEDEGADVLGGYNRAAMARGRANRRRKRRAAARQSARRRSRQRRRPRRSKSRRTAAARRRREFGRKARFHERKARYYRSRM